MKILRIALCLALILCMALGMMPTASAAASYKITVSGGALGQVKGQDSVTDTFSYGNSGSYCYSYT